MRAGPLKQVVRGALRVAGAPVAVLQRGRRREHDLRPPMFRPQFVAMIRERPALEIGPFDTPQLNGAGVRYFDVLDQDGLRRRAAALGRDVDGCPPIDFVSPTGDMSIIDGRFRAVFSSHAIEHQPDLIRHLREVERLLEPGGGLYVIVPDRRFTFDYFLPVTTTGEVEAAHAEARRLHVEPAIRAHYAATTHNSPIRHWLGMHGQIRPEADTRESTEAACERARRGEYVDVHAWIFTPESFGGIARELRAKGLIGLELERIYDTRFGGPEFFAVLRKPG